MSKEGCVEEYEQGPLPTPTWPLIGLTTGTTVAFPLIRRFKNILLVEQRDRTNQTLPPAKGWDDCFLIQCPVCSKEESCCCRLFIIGAAGVSDDQRLVPGQENGCSSHLYFIKLLLVCTRVAENWADINGKVHERDLVVRQNLAELCIGVHPKSGCDCLLWQKAATKTYEVSGSIQVLGCVTMLWSSWTIAANVNTVLDDEDLVDRKDVLEQLLRELDATI